MWAYLFFLPVPVTRWSPDIGGWVLMLLALQGIAAGYERLRLLRPMAALGLIVWVVNAFLPAASDSSSVARWLMIVRWGLLAAASWWLCRTVAGLARDRGSLPLVISAAWRRWTFPTAFVLLAASPMVPKRLEACYGVAFFVAAIISITAMMSLSVSVSRLLAMPAEPAEDSTERAEPEEPPDEG
jgi:hypothetical protein